MKYYTFTLVNQAGEEVGEYTVKATNEERATQEMLGELIRISPTNLSYKLAGIN